MKVERPGPAEIFYDVSVRQQHRIATARRPARAPAALAGWGDIARQAANSSQGFHCAPSAGVDSIQSDIDPQMYSRFLKLPPKHRLATVSGI